MSCAKNSLLFTKELHWLTNLTHCYAQCLHPSVHGGGFAVWLPGNVEAGGDADDDASALLYIVFQCLGVGHEEHCGAGWTLLYEKIGFTCKHYEGVVFVLGHVGHSSVDAAVIQPGRI